MANKFVERAMLEESSRIETKDKLSRRQKSLIKEAITSLPKEERSNQSKIMERFCQIMEDCYDKGSETEPGGRRNSRNLENQLGRMGIFSTADVRRKIDTYMATHANIQNR